MTETHQSLWDKIWKDKDGHIVIWQMPNIPLIVWVVATVISLLANGKIADVFSAIGSVSLAIWALLEIWKGVNYFRRALGVLVLLYIIASVLGVGK